jgi:UDPglucose 6-dehydrogenase
VSDPSHPPVLVVGAGYVGLVTAVGLAELGQRVELVETSAARLSALRHGRSPIHEPRLSEALSRALDGGRLTVGDVPGREFRAALVCVGTPIGPDGQSDLRQLRTALTGLSASLQAGGPLVIRSTLPPGATSLVPEWSGVATSRVFTNPEFLRQGTALADFLAPTRIVVGRFHDADPSALAVVTGLFDGIEAPRLVVDVAAAELIKNGANAFLALKLSFTNEIASLCEEYGADVDEVLAGISLDPRIGSQYMRPSFGFGGSCLPKELQALAAAGAARGLSMDVTIAASTANAAQQARFAERIEATLGGATDRTIALLGLAFKADTDDVRDSPGLHLAARLIRDGADVCAYDPQAGPNATRELPDLALSSSAEEALRGADAVVIATEWPEFKTLDWAALRGQMRQAIVFDGRRLLDGPQLVGLGFRYEAVGSAPTSQAAARERPSLTVADGEAR